MKNNRFKGFLKKAFSGRMAIVSSIVALILVGATLAYLFSVGKSIVNTFTPGSVDVEVDESYNGTTKSEIKLKNTGKSNAYLRMAITSYYKTSATIDGVEYEGVLGSKLPTLPVITLNKNWVKYGDYYYYTLPVAPGDSTTDIFNDSFAGITLDSIVEGEGEAQITYNQVVEVFAEAIQSAPAKAVQEAWGVTITEGKVTAYAG